MKVVWDEPKRLANLDKHGLDFVAVPAKFFLTAKIYPAKLGRLLAVGRLDNDVIVVIFVRLGSEGLSVISMRPASPKERSLLA